jgi:hypothetical protein
MPTHRQFRDATLAMVAIATTGFSSAFGQCSETTFLPSAPTINERAGSATALQGYTIAIGNPRDDTTASNDNFGSVDIYRFEPSLNQWLFDASLHAEGTPWQQELGTSVDLWGQFCIATAPKLALPSASGFEYAVGGVYVFVKFNGVWSQTALVTLPGDSEDNFAAWFGTDADLDDDFMVVGAPGMPWDAESIPGRAFVYRRESASEWVLEDSLNPNDLSGWYELQFGEVVAIERGASSATTFAMVGVPRFDTAGAPDCGEVMVFTKPNAGTDWSGWQVKPADSAAGDAFGAAVAADGLTMVVGAPGCDHGGHTDVGAAYVFTRAANGIDWNQTAKIPCPDPVDGAAFGASVDIEGTRIAIGSPARGTVHVYEKVGQFGVWTLDRTLSDATPEGGEAGMGSTVNLYGDTILAGEPDTRLLVQPAVGGAHLFDIGSAVGNDACGAGEIVVPNSSHTGCTIGATIDGGQTCMVSSNGTPDVWYQLVAPCTGTITLDTFGSSLDTVLSVHSGCPGTILNVIGCDDDFAPFLPYSLVTVPVTAGQVYRIRVAGKGGAVGQFTLNVGDCAPPCPADLNADGVVGASDLSILLGAWAAGPGSQADLDHSGSVDSADLATLLGAWGSCS